MEKRNGTAAVAEKTLASNNTAGGGEKTSDFIQMELQRKEGSNFGFNISGGVDQPHIPGHSGIFISRIRPDGPADVDGRLAIGDRIVSVNGIDLTQVSHQAAVDMFRQRVSSRCSLTVEKGAEQRILMEPAANLDLDHLDLDTVPPSLPRLPHHDGVTDGKKVVAGSMSSNSSTAGSKLSTTARAHVPYATSTSPQSSNATTIGDDGMPVVVKMKRPGFLDPHNPSLMTEVFLFSLGAAVIGVAGYVLYKRFIGRRS